MPDPDAARRRLIARRAALIRWADEPDRTAATRAARNAAFGRYEREVDPEGILPPAERRRRAKNLELAHMAKMQLKKMDKSRTSNAKDEATPPESS